ncbi:hypothetical protein [Phenylobacterium sp.]|jgi:hypothetical protein
MKVLGINRAELLVEDSEAAEATFKLLFNGSPGCQGLGTTHNNEGAGP